MIINVGPNKQFQTIQSAINALVASNPNGLSESSSIIIDTGEYAGFLIPPSSLGLNSLITLTIRSAPNARVLITGYKAINGNTAVGIGIGENNPYIKIEGLIIENFIKGIVISNSCHNCTINKNLIRMNSNVGLWIYRSERCTVTNNIILDNDNNIVCSDINEVFIAQNDSVQITSVLNSINPTNKTCLYVTTKPRTTNAPEGAILFYNNNFVSSGIGTVIKLDEKVLRKLRSDNNNIYNSFGLVFETISGANARFGESLSVFQAVTNNDHQSISSPLPHYETDPVAVSRTRLSINKFTFYEGIEAGVLDLCNAPLGSSGASLIPKNYIPSYVDRELLCQSFGTIGTTRGSRPSIGALETNTTISDSFYLPMAYSAYHQGNNSIPCIGKGLSGIQSIEEKYGQRVDCVYPSVGVGFFQIKDSLYYLYSDKKAEYIKDITYVEITLSTNPESISVYIDEKEYLDWSLSGTKLTIKCSGIDDLNKYITIIGSYKIWNNDGFTFKPFKQRTRLIDGDIRYLLSDIPKQGAPIVITDDLVTYSDNASLLGQEFTVKYSEEYEKAELVIGKATNLISNSQFDYLDSYISGQLFNTGDFLYAPSKWSLADNCSALCLNNYKYYTTGSSVEVLPYIGNRFLYLSGDGISQTIKITEKSSYWLSFYANNISQSISGQISTGTLMLSFYDTEGNALESTTKFFETTTGYEWSKLSYNLRDTGTGSYERIPSGSSYLEFAVSSSGIGLDAFSFFKSESLPKYSRRIEGKEATIEYESSESLIYDVTDLTITPIRNDNNNGFLYIGSVPAGQFDQNAPKYSTTLTDWGWQNGRLNYLPWAKVSGKNKLRMRGTINSTGNGSEEDIYVDRPVPYAENVDLFPKIPIASLEDGRGQLSYYDFDPDIGVAGVDISIYVKDNNQNPYSFEMIDVMLHNDVYQETNDNFLGMLAVKELGIYTQVSESCSTFTDSAGSAYVRWIPPSLEEISIDINSVNQLKRDENGYFIDDLPYKVNKVSHGNIHITTPRMPNGYSGYSSEYITEILSPVEDVKFKSQNYKAYLPTYYPDRMNIDIYVNATGNFLGVGQDTNVYDLRLNYSEIPELNNGQFFIDENNGIIYVNNSLVTKDQNRSIKSVYRKRLFYVVEGYNRRIYFDTEFINSIKNQISINNPLSITYDIVVDLVVKTRPPVGFDPDLTTINTVGSNTKTIDNYNKTLNVQMIGRSIKKRIGI